MQLADLKDERQEFSHHANSTELRENSATIFSQPNFHKKIGVNNLNHQFKNVIEPVIKPEIFELLGRCSPS